MKLAIRLTTVTLGLIGLLGPLAVATGTTLRPLTPGARNRLCRGWTGRYAVRRTPASSA